MDVQNFIVMILFEEFVGMFKARKNTSSTQHVETHILISHFFSLQCAYKKNFNFRVSSNLM